ncbi:MAG: hypothetical protein OXB84_01240, partial [Halobacteriovoraceae bacterium]|nr:hypothetical protein [Halobacteriovoraceae bacterium]
TNRENKKLQQSFNDPQSLSRKESCFCFRWNGTLSSFQEFSRFMDELENFFQKKNSINIPLYQNKLKDNLFFNFHQDAILDGKMLYSTSQDPSQITHPSFFDNLTNSCIPFNRFFHLELLNGNSDFQRSRDRLTSGLLGIHFKQEEKFPLILIVDYRNPSQIKLEITTSEAYRARLEQDGNVFFRYIGLRPKHLDLNINAFREFFNTNIGNQITQLSLGGSLRRLKAKMMSLLIPRFFLDTKTMPSHIEDKLNFIKMGQKEILKTHPVQLMEKYKDMEHVLRHLSIEHPWQILGLLSQFKYNINACLEKFNQSKNLNVDFSNPFLKESLLKLKIRPVYPDNQDVYIDLTITKSNQLHDTVDKIKQQKKGEDYYLEVYCRNKVIFNIYSSQAMTGFIHYILDKCPSNISASQLLKGLKVPSEKELSQLIDNFKETNKSIHTIYDAVNKLISDIMIQQISIGKQTSTFGLEHFISSKL